MPERVRLGTAPNGGQVPHVRDLWKKWDYGVSAAIIIFGLFLSASRLLFELFRLHSFEAKRFSLRSPRHFFAISPV